MKIFKKLLSLLLAISFVFGLPEMPIYASESDSGETECETLLETVIATGEETVINIPAVKEMRSIAEYNSASSNLNDIATYSVIGSDNRDQITNTTAHPYYGIAYLNTTFSNGNTYRGTGFMISKNVMLTAGHNLYEEGYKVTNITAYCGRNGDYKPLTATASVFYLDTKYTGSESNWDYGIIVFDENIGYTTGWFGLHATTSTSTVGATTVTVTGYPSDKAGRLMWTDSGTVSNITTYRFKHTADTYSGNSGSPTYYYSSEYGYQVVGIHTHSGNYSRRITVSLFNWLEDQGYIS